MKSIIRMKGHFTTKNLHFYTHSNFFLGTTDVAYDCEGIKNVATVEVFTDRSANIISVSCESECMTINFYNRLKI